MSLLQRRGVSICFVQETIWNRQKVKEIGEVYKIIYSGRTNARNDMEVIIDENLKNIVVNIGISTEVLSR